MKIELKGPAVPADDGGVSFRAYVDEKLVACRFTWEALQDVDPENREADAMSQFEANKDKLLGVAQQMILDGRTAGGVVVIHSSDVQ